MLHIVQLHRLCRKALPEGATTRNKEQSFSCIVEAESLARKGKEHSILNSSCKVRCRTWLTAAIAVSNEAQKAPHTKVCFHAMEIRFLHFSLVKPLRNTKDAFHHPGTRLYTIMVFYLYERHAAGYTRLQHLSLNAQR